MKKTSFIDHVPKFLNWVILDFTLCPREDVSVIYEFLVIQLVAPAVETNELELVFFSFNDADEILVYFRHRVFNETKQYIFLRCKAVGFDIFNFHLNHFVG